MIIELLAMVGGALLGVPTTEAYSWAQRKLRQTGELIERALLESFIESVGALADQAVRESRSR
ncbi:hypothetical protein [Streptomyces flavofungini]|uniref:hypothetical protein n=1 Tax=Streptomyces flavofungini TaxID=68200 RepID=UPI0034DE4559